MIQRLVSRAYLVRWTIEAVVQVPAELGVGEKAEEWATNVERIVGGGDNYVVDTFFSTTESVDRELSEDKYGEEE